jgi:hypothetical protein
MMNRLGRIAQTVEFTVAGLITAGVVALHLNVMQHAGPLWRDEISSLRVATMPTLGALWSALVYDPIPVLFFALLRVWNFLCGGASDEHLRQLGFVVGLSITAALWLSAWAMKKAPPLWALLLFGLSPVALVWGDSMRAYGIGCLFNILAVGCIWNVTSERPRLPAIAVALLTALLSVHSLFTNSLLLFAAIAGAVVVATLHRWWRTLLILSGIGFLAAISLLPYQGIIRMTQSWSGLCKAGINSAWIITMLNRALLSGGQLASFLWIAGSVLTALGLIVAIVRPQLIRLDTTERNLVVYAGTTLMVATATTVGFFTWVGWATSVWYYLPLMATLVVCIDSLGRVLRKSAYATMANALLVLFAAMVLSPLALQATNMRLTNVDLTTAVIAQRAHPNDLVVIDNYFYGISFNRYYHGQAPWVSVPNVNDFSLHRWDLLTDSMRHPRPIQPVLDRIDTTLKAGHDVYVVGFALTNRTAAAASLPVAPAGSSGWSLWPYVRRWTTEIAYTVQAHAAHGQIITVPAAQPINVAEDVHAIVVTGWKERNVATTP